MAEFSPVSSLTIPGKSICGNLWILWRNLSHENLHEGDVSRRDHIHAKPHSSFSTKSSASHETPVLNASPAPSGLLLLKGFSSSLLKSLFRMSESSEDPSQTTEESPPPLPPQPTSKPPAIASEPDVTSDPNEHSFAEFSDPGEPVALVWRELRVRPPSSRLFRPEYHIPARIKLPYPSPLSGACQEDGPRAAARHERPGSSPRASRFDGSERRRQDHPPQHSPVPQPQGPRGAP